MLFRSCLPGANPSWFGFPIVVADGAPFTKVELVNYLDEKKIATRAIFAGNLTRHPAYVGHPNIRKVGNLPNSDKLMNDAFWIGVHPGLTKQMLKYIVRTIESFISQHSNH